MTAQLRVHYDAIAHLYDIQPYRRKVVDPHLHAFLRERGALSRESLAILDLGCGTGSQLIADAPDVPHARLVGLDLSWGMLAQARRKAPGLRWIQGDSSCPPLADGQFDYITSQFAFHHVRDKAAMLRAVWRLLRPGGRFVLTNLVPQEMPGWVYYHYFPLARAIDLEHFLPPEAIAAQLRAIGMAGVTCKLERSAGRQDLAAFLSLVQQRHVCSQLLAISDADYAAGRAAIAHDLRQG
jgi:ubiquinone/menaquinone biosynthesis C-methylase UbiE